MLLSACFVRIVGHQAGLLAEGLHTWIAAIMRNATGGTVMLRWSIALALVVVLAGAAVGEVTVTYLGDMTSYPTVDFSTVYDGVVGNCGQPGGLVTEPLNTWVGVATTFDPLAGDSPCGDGFTVEVLHMVVAKPTPSPTPFSARFALGNAFLRSNYPPGPACFWPTACPPGSYGYAHYCWHEVDTLMESAGFYEIVFTGDLADCGCISTAYTHSLAIMRHYPDVEPVLLVTDYNPGHCPDHQAVEYFMGSCFWETFEADGNLMFWAEISCCEPPVGAKQASWGTLKALYNLER
jgi:hypothetical protein